MTNSACVNRHWNPMPLVALLLLVRHQVDGFQVPPARPLPSSLLQSAPVRGISRTSWNKSSKLHFWGNKKDKEDDNDDNVDNVENNEDEIANGSEKKRSLFPFFASKTAEATDAVKEKEASPATTVATPPQSRSVNNLPTDPTEQAAALRAQAERARLEAEKMDAELTLRKISRLEKEMATAVAKDKKDDIERLQQEMDALQAKIRGEAPKPVVVPAKGSEATAAIARTSASSSTASVSTPSSSRTFKDTFLAQLGKAGELKGYTAEELEESKKNYENAPGFLKKIMAASVDLDSYENIEDINATEVALRLVKLTNLDFSYSNLPAPSFTQADIDRAKEELKSDWSKKNNLENYLVESAKGNETKLALMALEWDYYADSTIETFFETETIEKLTEGEDWLKEIVEAVNKSGVDSAIETLYPKCTRKEDASLPTLAQVNQLMTDVLPKASFTARGKPEPVLGGYIIRGTSKFEKGDAVIEAIDEQLAKFPALKDSMTVLWTQDFTLLAEDDEDYASFATIEFVDPDSQPPILFVMGPDIVVERKRVPLALITSVGIATTWYLAVYPFLLNPTIMKRTEEQLALADASMAYDLSWLSELSLPLFLTFFGIQLAHEAGHKIAASASGLNTTFPTLVPSLVTGITSSVTNLKEPPKNTEALFDFALAGPLCGILASVSALVVGSQLTVASDPSNFPALPLEILRQSTLGGGIINNLLGNGALSLPPGAEGTQAVAEMTVALHPVAVAGYIGLIVNALALLPIGTTDGGRVALALYGRGGKLVVGNIFMIMVFLVGVLGSDLFLFYFAFLSGFQTGNEIPARNEVEKISFARVIIAIASTVLALLSLVPFQ